MRSEKIWGGMALVLFALAGGGLASGCVFDDTALATKTSCRSDGDCLDGRICACRECVLPQFVPASCGIGSPDEDAGGGNNSDPVDVGDDGADNNDNNGRDGGDEQSMNNAGIDADADVPCTTPSNACGGCAELEGAPGEACGVCPAGRWACDGEEAVVCEGGETNACGGCVALPGGPGDPCGVCADGIYACRGNFLICEGLGLNVCGGCETLDNELGESCGVCDQGEFICSEDNESLTCTVPDASNSCGGCASLPMQVGEACGECGTGVATCVGEDEIECRGGARNSCGGCTTLPQTEGGLCGCGSDAWTCVEADTLACLDSFAPMNAPVDLGSMNSGDSRRELEGVLHSPEDEDWYTWTADDGLGDIAPDVQLQVPADYGVCVYFTWNEDDGDRTPGCTQGSANVFEGLEGCCSDSEQGNEAVELSIDAFLRNDAGRIRVRVFSARGASSCEPYTLRYRL